MDQKLVDKVAVMLHGKTVSLETANAMIQEIMIHVESLSLPQVALAQEGPSCLARRGE